MASLLSGITGRKRVYFRPFHHCFFPLTCHSPQSMNSEVTSFTKGRGWGVGHVRDRPSPSAPPNQPAQHVPSSYTPPPVHSGSGLRELTSFCYVKCGVPDPPSLSPAHCSANEPVHPLPQRCCQQPHCVLGSPVGISKWCHLSHKVTASPKASLGMGSPIWPPPPAKGHLPWRMSCCHRQSCSLGWNLQTSDVCNSRGLPCQTQE